MFVVGSDHQIEHPFGKPFLFDRRRSVRGGRQLAVLAEMIAEPSKLVQRPAANEKLCVLWPDLHPNAALSRTPCARG